MVTPEPNEEEMQAAAATNDQASARVRRGIALLGGNTPDSLRAAVREFDAAIAARRDLPFKLNPWFLYAHIAGWLNRGDALTRLGGAPNLAEALRSYDEALRLLRDLPLDVDPLFRRRLAIAWQNRGLTLQAQGGAPACAEALRSFDEAISVLDDTRAHSIADRELLLATIWMNRGNVLLQATPTDAAIQAQEAARQAGALVANTENHDVTAAEIGFKARHILCQAIAHLLARPGLTASASSELLDEASDAVDAGMGLARQWEARGEHRFRPLAGELFRFGSRVYQTHQPHFLVEFLLENLDPEQSPGAIPASRVMHAAAVEALWRALRNMQREGFKQLNAQQFDQMLASLRELRFAEEKLAELRRSVEGGGTPGLPTTTWRASADRRTSGEASAAKGVEMQISRSDAFSTRLLKEPNTKEQKFEVVVEAAEQAAVLVLVY